MTSANMRHGNTCQLGLLQHHGLEAVAVTPWQHIHSLTYYDCAGNFEGCTELQSFEDCLGQTWQGLLFQHSRSLFSHMDWHYGMALKSA